MLAEQLPADPEALVFTAHQGGPVRHTLFRKRGFKPAAKAALLAQPNLRWHDLRHTCASLLIASGANILAVSERLGHAKPSMTLDVYGHLFPSDEAACAVALDKVHDNVISLRAAA
jgi:integrase